MIDDDLFHVLVQMLEHIQAAYMFMNNAQVYENVEPSRPLIDALIQLEKVIYEVMQQ